MRIVHVINSIAPSRGGPTNVVLHLARAQAKSGLEVEVVSTRADLDAAGEAEARSFLGQIPLTLVAVAGPARVELAPLLIPALFSRLRRADLVHVHTVFTYPVAVTPVFCRLLRVPYIIRPAGTLDAVCIASRSERQKRLALALVCRRNLVEAAAVHATSAHEKRELQALVPEARTEVVENGVEVETLSEVPADSGGQGRRIGFLGRLHPKKGLERLLDAVARLPDVELEVAGAGDPDYERHLRQIAAGRRVRWLGHVSDKRSFFERVDVLAFPSSDENFGLAVAESAAAGRAVVVSPGVALAGDLEAAGAGVVCAPDGVALARTLDALLHDGKRRAALGAAGRRLAQSRWSWSRIAESTTALYRTC
jgi:glycosyltransferase involved in cell wall biosynthesis